MQAAHALSASQSRPRGRRKTLFINPGFQWRYAALVASGVFIIALLMCTVMYGVLYEQARARMVYQVPARALENTLSLVVFAGVFALTMAAAFGLWSVISSHRVCGPLFVLERYLQEVCDGRIPNMRDLRKGDEFQQFYQVARNAMENLRTDRQVDLAACREALELARRVQDGPETVRAQALAALRDRLESIQSRASVALGESMGDRQATDAPAEAIAKSPAREHAEIGA